MSALLSTLLFAMTASATVTTTIRGPFFDYNGEPATYPASVVGVGKDKTTIALQVTYEEEDSTRTTMETYTWYGSTKVEASSSTSDLGGMGALTVRATCDMPVSAKGACTYSYGGEYFKNGYCSELSSYTAPITSTYTEVYDGTTSLSFETYDPRTELTGNQMEELLDMCTGKGDIPDELAIRTETLGMSEIATATLIITAGEEKLKATAGATPNKNEPEPTDTQTKDGSPAKTEAAGAAESTGAAALNVVPALAGLGAAVAAFML